MKKEPLGFQYNPDDDLERINADLRVAVVTYRRMTGSNGDQGAKTVAEMEDCTKKASKLMA